MEQLQGYQTLIQEGSHTYWAWSSAAFLPSLRPSLPPPSKLALRSAGLTAEKLVGGPNQNARHAPGEVGAEEGRSSSSSSPLSPG